MLPCMPTAASACDIIATWAQGNYALHARTQTVPHELGLDPRLTWSRKVWVSMRTTTTRRLRSVLNRLISSFCTAIRVKRGYHSVSQFVTLTSLRMKRLRVRENKATSPLGWGGGRPNRSRTNCA